MTEDSTRELFRGAKISPRNRAISVTQAREAVAEKPGHYKAAVIEGQPPLRDLPGNEVVLFRLVKSANEYLRERLKQLESAGWKRERYGITYGIVTLGKSGETLTLGIDKR